MFIDNMYYTILIIITNIWYIDSTTWPLGHNILTTKCRHIIFHIGNHCGQKSLKELLTIRIHLHTAKNGLSFKVRQTLLTSIRATNVETCGGWAVPSSEQFHYVWFIENWHTHFVCYE